MDAYAKTFTDKTLNLKLKISTFGNLNKRLSAFKMSATKIKLKTSMGIATISVLMNTITSVPLKNVS